MGLNDVFADSTSPGFHWWGLRAGDFHQGRGMRIDLLLVSDDLPAGLRVRSGTATPARGKAFGSCAR